MEPNEKFYNSGNQVGIYSAEQVDIIKCIDEAGGMICVLPGKEPPGIMFEPGKKPALWLMDGWYAKASHDEVTTVLQQFLNDIKGRFVRFCCRHETDLHNSKAVQSETAV